MKVYFCKEHNVKKYHRGIRYETKESILGKCLSFELSPDELEKILINRSWFKEKTPKTKVTMEGMEKLNKFHKTPE